MEDQPRILIWCAVSSKPQAGENKSSLQVQEKEGRAYADMHNGTVVDVLRVPGHSRDLWRWDDAEEAMPAYRRLREYCENGAFDVLFTWDSDRLGRDAALSQQVLSLVKRAGASIYVYSGGYTVGQQSESASYIYAIDGVRSGQEQKRRVKRHRFGMINRVRRGLHPHKWPYGYRAIRDARGECVGAEFVAHEIEVVRIVAQLYLDGYGYDHISRRLNERGYLGPAGGQWWPGAVLRVIQSDVYAGYVGWGGARNERPSDKFPALWDTEQHRAIKRERHRRRNIGGGAPIATYLSGCVICAECGWSMSHHRVPSHTDPNVVYRYYTCKRTTHPANNVRVDDLTEAFDAWLSSIAGVGIDLALREGQPEERGRLESERDTLESNVLDAEEGLDRLAAAVASGTIQATTAQRTEERLLDQIDAHRVRMSEIDDELAALPDPSEQREYLQQIVALGTSDLDDARMHRLNRALRNLGVRFICKRGELQAITY